MSISENNANYEVVPGAGPARLLLPRIRAGPVTLLSRPDVTFFT